MRAGRSGLRWALGLGRLGAFWLVLSRRGAVGEGWAVVRAGALHDLDVALVREVLRRGLGG